jgi:hypothetical protein
MISFSFSLEKKFEQNYFDGNWLMYGYTCNGKEPKVEKCHCVTTGKQVICKKTVGDDCVTTGHETFRFTLPAQVETGKNVALTYVVGSPQRPNSGHWKNKFQVKDINTFVSQSRKYVRDPKRMDATPVAPVVPVAPVAPVDPKPTQINPLQQAKPLKIVYFNSNYFLGNWHATGYTCNFRTPQVEVINIKHIGKSLRLAAKKIVGDDCIGAGQDSFHFIQPQKVWHGQTISANLQIGAPDTKKTQWKQMTIEVIDVNTFRINSHVFYRSVGVAGRPTHGAYINMQPVVGHGAYPGPAYIKVNPQTNLRHPVRRFVIVEESINKPGNC